MISRSSHYRRLCRAFALALVAMLAVGIVAPAATAQQEEASQVPRRGREVRELRPVPVQAARPARQQQREPTNLHARQQVGQGQRRSDPVDPIDMKLLVISADGQEQFDFDALKAQLDRLAVPYDVLIASTKTLNGVSYVQNGITPPVALSRILSNGVAPAQGGQGFYQGIMLTTGNLGYSPDGGRTWISGFADAEWSALADYERTFGIRQVTNYTYPSGAPSSYCMQLSPRVFVDTLATPLQTTLTTAGRSVFSYLNPVSPVTIANAWTYLAYAQPGAAITPLLTAPDGAGGQYLIASTCQFDGRENLAMTAANNPNLVHSELLSYGVVNWVTRGRFLGERHVYMGVQIDDLFIPSDVWDASKAQPNVPFDPGADCIESASIRCPLARMNASDITALVAWQNQKSAQPNTPQFRVEFAFNGVGTDATQLEPQFLPDNLTPAVVANNNAFNFVNHTYTHRNLDQSCTQYAQPITFPALCIAFAPTTYQQATDEFRQNNQLRNNIGLQRYFRDSLVQPDISGLANANAMRAAFDFGIRYLISDTSRPGGGNPFPNTGFANASQPGILVIPRRPTNLFYNLYRPADWVAEYNCFYSWASPIRCGGTAFDQFRYSTVNLTYDQILDKEADAWLQYLLKWDIDPLMFHQANVIQHTANHSLLSDLIDRTLTKYNAMYTLPIRGIAQHDVGLKMQERMTYRASGVKGVMVPCGAPSGTPSITLTAPRAAVVPVTGVQFGNNTEVYGGQRISYVQLAANTPRTIPLTCP